MHLKALKVSLTWHRPFKKQLRSESPLQDEFVSFQDKLISVLSFMCCDSKDHPPKRGYLSLCVHVLLNAVKTEVVWAGKQKLKKIQTTRNCSLLDRNPDSPPRACNKSADRVHRRYSAVRLSATALLVHVSGRSCAPRPANPNSRIGRGIVVSMNLLALKLNLLAD